MNNDHHRRMSPVHCRRLTSLFLLAILPSCATLDPQTGSRLRDRTAVGTPRSGANGAPVYLADLPPLWVNTLADRHWGFGNHGLLGARIDGKLYRIAVNGRHFEHSLGTHPRAGEGSRVVYSLGRSFKTLFGSVGVSDVGSPLRSTLTFEIIGDGRRLWRSSPINGPGRLLEFGVDVQGVDHLELVVHCPGDNHAAHAVWIEPRLQRDA